MITSEEFERVHGSPPYSWVRLQARNPHLQQRLIPYILKGSLYLVDEIVTSLDDHDIPLEDRMITTLEQVLFRCIPAGSEREWTRMAVAFAILRHAGPSMAHYHIQRWRESPYWFESMQGVYEDLQQDWRRSP